MEVVEQLFKRRWPRLYLDTAEVIAIGRGHLPASFVDELIASIEKHSVILVISHAHLRDMLKPGDRDAPGLLASTLERFWIRGLVDRGPWAIEPWTSGPVDIDLLPWGNVREVLEAPGATSNLAEHDLIQTIAHAGDMSFKKVQRSTAPRTKGRLSNNHEAIIAGSAMVLALGLQPDVAAAVDWCAQAIACTLTASERAGLIEKVAPAEAALETMSQFFTMITPEERLNLWPLIKADPEVAPGTCLSKTLAGNRLRNVGRDPERSDSIDLEHCSYIPYVDIATCDRQAYAAIAPRLLDVKGTRTPTLFRNGQLEAVLTHIRKLPTRKQIFEESMRTHGE